MLTAQGVQAVRLQRDGVLVGLVHTSGCMSCIYLSQALTRRAHPRRVLMPGATSVILTGAWHSVRLQLYLSRCFTQPTAAV